MEFFTFGKSRHPLQDLHFNIWAVFIFMAAVHGLLLALVLWQKRENRKANKTFAVLIAAVSLHLGEYTLSISGILLLVPHLMFTTYPLFFVIGPLFYLYVRALLQPGLGKRWGQLMHFLPAFTCFLLLLPFYLQSGEEKVRFFLDVAADNFGQAPAAQFIVMYLQMVQTGIYLYLALSVIKAEEKNLKESRANGNLIKIVWLKNATAILFGYVIFYALMTAFLLINKSYRIEADYIVVLVLAALVYSTGYIALSQPAIFNESFKRNQKKPSLPAGLSLDIKSTLARYMEEERPYLTEDLKISEVAEALGAPIHHLSEVINQEFRSNFFDFVNTYRVEEAKRLLKDSDVKILAVAFDSGFGNKATFNRVFKRFTGLTPSEFRERSVGQTDH